MNGNLNLILNYHICIVDVRNNNLQLLKNVLQSKCENIKLKSQYTPFNIKRNCKNAIYTYTRNCPSSCSHAMFVMSIMISSNNFDTVYSVATKLRSSGAIFLV